MRRANHDAAFDARLVGMIAPQDAAGMPQRPFVSHAPEMAMRGSYCPRGQLCCHRRGQSLLRFGGWSMGRKFDLWLFCLSIAWLVLVSSALVGMLLQWGGSE